MDDKTRHQYEIQHKANQYDSIVMILKVCDGGRYRYDTISSLLAKIKHAEDVEKQLAEALEKLTMARDWSADMRRAFDLIPSKAGAMFIEQLNVVDAALAQREDGK